MILLAPIYFYCSLAAAAGVFALHCIVTRQPDSTPFPTVRFVPQGEVRVIALARAHDPVVLALRLLAVLLVGLAAAHPVWSAGRRAFIRIVLLDRSSVVASLREAQDSAQAWLREGDVLIPFDSAELGLETSIKDLGRSESPGRLTPALIAALRVATQHRQEADSIELVVVSPLTDREFDGATAPVRALWPGAIRLAPLAAAPDPPDSRAVDVPADGGVGIAASLAGLRGTSTPIRLRTHLTAADSTWAADSTRTLVLWDTIPSARWQQVPAQVVNGVVAGESPFLYPLQRKYVVTPGRTDRVVARWIDGVPVAVERVLGRGCVREVAVPVPLEGDLVVRLPFRHLVMALLAPCHAVSGGTAISAAARAALIGQGPMAPAAAFPAADFGRVPPIPWLILAALLVLGAEQWIRRRPVDLPKSGGGR